MRTTAGVVALLLATTACSGSENTAAPAPAVTVTVTAEPTSEAPAPPSPAESPSTTQLPSANGGAEQVFEQYVDENGGTPAATPPDNGLFGLTLGAPVERALALLGLEDQRYGTDPDRPGGSLAREWQRGSLTITVDAGEDDAVTSIAVTRYGAQPDDPWRAALPDGLVLGKASIADVLKIHGQPHDVADQGFQEGTFGYDFAYRGGPEGSELATFTVVSDVDLGRLTMRMVPFELQDQLVTVYQIGY